MSGVRASDRAPVCQQSPEGFSGVGVVVLAEKGVNGLAVPVTTPITTGAPVRASRRVTLIVADPKDGRLVATTESPETTIVAPVPLEGAGEACATAEAHSAPTPVSTAAVGAAHRRR